ncbi:phage major capsid protein [uncultured Selenomonas sp.]|uniref:phage major capsid protein n=1 Tax=uncultured Selenomonas sp. TaxID=159275 RepID=UPI0028D594A8|nr:phage major capsid protein [uncultured Selenomonas sp.]
MKKSDELKKTVDELRAQIENMQQEERYEAAAKLSKELTDAVHQYQAAAAMEAAQIADFAGDAAPIATAKLSDAVMHNRVFNKLVLGRALDAQEREFANQIGSPGMAEGTPSKGGYLVPEEQMAQIREYRKAYTALKDFAHVQQANSTSGKMPTLGDETGKLVAFEELNSIQQSDFDFGQLKYEIKDYGDIIPVSNQLLADADVNITAIIGQRFARKAVNTENDEILKALKTLTPEEVTDEKGVMKILNVSLDPAYYANARILTNQDGFQWLSELEDAQKRPLLVPDVVAPDTYRFRGKEIIVVSNGTLATVSKKVPFYIGSFADYVAFFERRGVEIAVSQDFLFDKYATALRCVERFGVVADDKDAVKLVQVTLP